MKRSKNFILEFYWLKYTNNYNKSVTVLTFSYNPNNI